MGAVFGEWWVTQCGWNTWCVRGIRRAVQVWGRSLSAVWIVTLASARWACRRYICPQPNFFQSLLSFSPVLVRMAFWGKAPTCGDCKLSSFQWLLRCPFSRKSTHAGQNRVNDFPLNIPAQCRTFSSSPKCIYSAFSILCPQLTFWFHIFAFSLDVLYLSI